MSVQRTLRPLGVSSLAVVLFLFGLFAFFGSLFMWGEGFLLSFPPGVDYRFPVTDILVNAPASLLAAIGLWKMKQWGYVATQFVAGFYIYGSVEIFVMTIQKAHLSRSRLSFHKSRPSSVYLWRIRTQFV